MPSQQQAKSQSAPGNTVAAWDAGAEKELKKIPFFVRGKARRNTERYALERGVTVITTETLYESKAYFSQS
jgi:light-independent protochlorophyllide reductase subunit B